MEPTQQSSDDSGKPSSEPLSLATTDLKSEVERLSRELAAAQQERSQSAAYGLELLNEKEKLQEKYESIETAYEQSKMDLQELREAWNKAINKQRISATTVFEKEVQLLNDTDALAASLTHAKQETEKELRLTKSLLETALGEKERYFSERDELAKEVGALEQERRNLKNELREVRNRETRLINENSELEEENVSLQKQVSNLRSAQVEFESSKHEIQRLQDEVIALNSQLEEMVTLKRINERQTQEALEALQSEREQKYALRKELDKRNTADLSINWTSLAALKGSPHLANLALRNLGTSGGCGSSVAREDGSPNGFGSDQDGATTFSDVDPGYDMLHEFEMPSIEGSLFDEVHLSEIKKLQQSLEEKENQRSNLNTKLIDIQHKLDSKNRQAEEIEKKLSTICLLVEEFYAESDLPKTPSRQRTSSLDTQSGNGKQQQQPSDGSSNTESKAIEDNAVVVSSTTGEINGLIAQATTKSSILDDFDNIYSHLQALYAAHQGRSALQTTLESGKENLTASAQESIVSLQSRNINLIDQPITESVDNAKLAEAAETYAGDDVQSLRAMLDKKHEQLKQLRTVLRSNKESAEVALKNLKSKYDMEKAIVTETMTKLRLEHKRLNEDAATFASLRSHFSARIEEYNTEIEKLQSKLAASEQEKTTLNSLLRMAIEQKVMLTQRLEAIEMDQESKRDQHDHHHNSTNKSNGQQPRSGMMRGRGGPLGGRGGNPRSARTMRPGGANQGQR